MKTFNMNSTTFEKWFTAQKDPQIDQWPLMSSPIPVLSILGIYLLFVFKIGPKFMNKREPYNLRQFIILYNGFQVLNSALMCFYIRGIRVDYVYYLITNGCHPNKTPKFLLDIHTGAWWYLMAKITEFIDTICFILRKKFTQVTKLHVYHHAMTFFVTWSYLKYLPGEQAMVIAFNNNFVHIFMYGYYFLSALGPKYQKYLWWKRYVTVLQLIQFTLNIVYYIALFLLDCDAPKFLSLVFTIHCGIFIV
ncbi:elongation of very long chain fatty acids protein 4-like [Chrysoperla carnea]|uniref:elongation of very long chain fatty acids protein 4-like n=1 Tax=Chrysoperla carnea TaxID=189513 RepID=UPI001D08D677|nr:elongation of very long chain fatty acids protein 4-like [Chrysoperla carnea]